MVISPGFTLVSLKTKASSGSSVKKSRQKSSVLEMLQKSGKLVSKAGHVVTVRNQITVTANWSTTICLLKVIANQPQMTNHPPMRQCKFAHTS